MTKDQMQQVLDALQAVEALIEHEYTGTREAMSALQNAADDAQDAIAIMQAAVDAPDIQGYGVHLDGVHIFDDVVKKAVFLYMTRDLK